LVRSDDDAALYDTALIGREKTMAADERQLRIDLAAAFRLASHFGWNESIANHFSLAVSDDGQTFLMNPKWTHFDHVTASNLLLIDANDPKTMDRPDAPDPTAWVIHGHLHRALPHARCILHVHSSYATAIASLADPEIKPIDQNTARFFNRVAFDMSYGGLADNDAEGEHLVRALGNKSILMMANHGVLVAGSTVAEAFDALYYLERACKNLVLAYSTGQKLNILSNAVAEKTAQGWECDPAWAPAHFAQMKLIMSRKDASFAS
jgi:ribulose-5-phosphate 4-epimerase/fuculose-1-phosphate aldolase